MIELTKRTVLKIALGTVFICSFILALMYPVISASHKDKIYFLISPNPIAVFAPPLGKEANVMLVWVAVIKDSTYGSFTMALVAYETYYADHSYYEYHWYTDNLRGGETMAYPLESSWQGIPFVWDYEVSLARIDVSMSEHQLNATVVVKGKTLFTAGFWANTDVPVVSRIAGTELPPELYLSVEAYRPLLKVLVTGLEVGDLTGGRFEYIDTELIDSSLLP